MRFKTLGLLAAMLVCAGAALDRGYAADDGRDRIRSAVDETIRPLMQQNGIPGMAVGIVTKAGHHVFNYGVASKDSKKPVTGDTLFEIGSISKTFTATLASYAQAKGRLALSDSASKHFPSLRGGAFDTVTLLNLGTHTQGGMPMQVPDEIRNDDQLIAYYKSWRPPHAAGTHRTYTNPSIGLLGMIAARSMNEDFVALMQGTLFPALGLARTYLEVPDAEKGHYAQGYTRKDEPIRMAPGVLAAEAYGVRTTAADMVRFVEANMAMLDLDPTLQRAITDTHTGYFKVGPMTQDLIWEQYAYPADLRDLLTGNSAKISFETNPAIKIDPPLPPRGDVLINKTGSTNGFGGYVAFIPDKKLGIVLLANKNYPIEARVSAAYRILSRLDANTASRE